ncbi:hypothetical protein PSP6_320146 [Paraburkholderia tropica]|nr:hypothetical protein PSP6_320146 [Paraburkholderia tropica]
MLARCGASTRSGSGAAASARSMNPFISAHASAAILARRPMTGSFARYSTFTLDAVGFNRSLINPP